MRALFRRLFSRYIILSFCHQSISICFFEETTDRSVGRDIVDAFARSTCLASVVVVIYCSGWGGGGVLVSRNNGPHSLFEIEPSVPIVNPI